MHHDIAPDDRRAFANRRRFWAREAYHADAEVCPLTKPLSSAGETARLYRSGAISEAEYMRRVGNDNGAGRRVLVSWAGTAHELRAFVTWLRRAS